MTACPKRGVCHREDEEDDDEDVDCLREKSRAMRALPEALKEKEIVAVAKVEAPKEEERADPPLIYAPVSTRDFIGPAAAREPHQAPRGDMYIRRSSTTWGDAPQ